MVLGRVFAVEAVAVAAGVLVVAGLVFVGFVPGLFGVVRLESARFPVATVKEWVVVAPMGEGLYVYRVWLPFGGNVSVGCLDERGGLGVPVGVFEGVAGFRVFSVRCGGWGGYVRVSVVVPPMTVDVGYVSVSKRWP